MTNDMKETKAVTLIALVITIAILLILAGVSISMITGTDRNNGTGINSEKRNR